MRMKNILKTTSVIFMFSSRLKLNDSYFSPFCCNEGFDWCLSEIFWWVEKRKLENKEQNIDK